MSLEPPGKKQVAIKDEDRDSLFILPMPTLPLRTPGLLRARMIKDSRLESAIEMFSDKITGSGRIYVDQLEQVFGELTEDLEHDAEILSRVADLNSFDVFSLRIELRRLEIKVDEHEALRLSESRSEELANYMRDFTRPLVQQIYGAQNAQVQGMGELINLFQSPDKEMVLNNIMKMAERLEVHPSEVPEFLEEYGDVFLSLAYYKDILDDLVPRLEKFTNEMKDILSNHQVKQDVRIAGACEVLDERLQDVAASITGRFQSFERNSKTLWDDINAESFKKMKTLVTSHYATIGGVLCGLTVKIKAWEERFAKGKGGPVSKADFIMSEMRHGISAIDAIERSAPQITDI